MAKIKFYNTKKNHDRKTLTPIVDFNSMDVLKNNIILWFFKSKISTIISLLSIMILLSCNEIDKQKEKQVVNNLEHDENYEEIFIKLTTFNPLYCSFLNVDGTDYIYGIVNKSRLVGDNKLIFEENIDQRFYLYELKRGIYDWVINKDSLILSEDCNYIRFDSNFSRVQINNIHYFYLEFEIFHAGNHMSSTELNFGVLNLKTNQLLSLKYDISRLYGMGEKGDKVFKEYLNKEEFENNKQLLEFLLTKSNTYISNINNNNNKDDDDKNLLHHSIQDFEENMLVLETKSFRIRIDRLEENNYRLVQWNIENSNSDKPNVIIHYGERIQDGSGGNYYYEFRNGPNIYQCHITIIGTVDSPPGYFRVYNNGSEVINQSATRVY